MPYMEWYNNSSAASALATEHEHLKRYYYGWASISNTFRQRRTRGSPDRNNRPFDFIGHDLPSLTADGAPEVMRPWPDLMQVRCLNVAFKWKVR
eukprot:SAG31_NODE_979_length_10600_cov_13.736025_7_plen_94_part_00